LHIRRPQVSVCKSRAKIGFSQSFSIRRIVGRIQSGTPNQWIWHVVAIKNQTITSSLIIQLPTDPRTNEFHIGIAPTSANYALQINGSHIGITQPPNLPINQSSKCANQQIHQSANQPINQSSNHANHPILQSTNQSNQTTAKSTGEQPTQCNQSPIKAIADVKSRSRSQVGSAGCAERIQYVCLCLTVCKSVCMYVCM